MIAIKIKVNTSDLSISKTKELIFDYQAISFSTQIKLLPNQHYFLLGVTATGKYTFLEAIHYAALSKGLSSVFVLQEPYLFNQSLGQNLFLNIDLTAENKELAISLLHLFELDSLAGNSEELLELAVGEKGKKLSGGQVKRLHMIRSLLFDYDLILWDDPFSALDVMTEKKVLTELTGNFDKYFKNKILILTTHRQSTLKYFNNSIFCTREELLMGNLTEPNFKSKVDNFFKSQKS